MAQIVNVILSTEDRERLLAIASDRSRPLKHVQRARIILLSAERLPVLQVADQAGVSRPAVWRWQQRYGEEGIDGLLRDKTREPGRSPLSAGVVAKVLALTCSEPPGEATHWTGRAMAKAVGVSLRTVHVFGTPTASSRIACARLSAPMIQNSPRRSKTWSASTWTRRRMPSSSPSTRRARYKLSIAPSRACRSNLASVGQ